MKAPEFLTRSEVAAMLRVTVRTVDRWCSGSNPTLPCVAITRGSRRTLRFHRDTILSLCQTTPTTPRGQSRLPAAASHGIAGRTRGPGASISETAAPLQQGAPATLD